VAAEERVALYTPDPAARVTDHPGFRRMFAPGRLSVGVFFPIENFKGDQPTML